MNKSLVSLINRICPAHCNFDSKVMIAVGILRWYFNYQREEIQSLFFARGIEISTGEISNLSEQFLVRFYVLHKKHIPKMKCLFKKKGGIRLHLDGTGEAGNEIVFTAKDGETGITLDAQIMQTESKENVKSFLQTLKLSFGSPIVVVRDMSKQIREAASEVFPGIEQQICHYHFVKNLGKIIFKKKYSEFRKGIIKMQLLSRLKKMRDHLRDVTDLTSETFLVVAEHKWIALAIEHVLICRERSSNYPFILPYLETMNRILEVQNMSGKIIEWNTTHKLQVDEIKEFADILDKITGDADINAKYIDLKQIWEWFEKVRICLRIGRHLSRNGTNSSPSSAQELKQNMEETLAAIDNKGKAIGKELFKVSSQITKNCKQHAHELFVEIKDSCGNIVEIMRDNNIEERGHRWNRMHIRRRTGRSRTTNEMAQYGALTSVISNLENKVYVKNVLSDVDDFVRAMQDITHEEINKAKEMIKPYIRKEIVRSDNKRANLLKEFVGLIEAGHSIESWLSKIKFSNVKMTP